MFRVSLALLLLSSVVQAEETFRDLVIRHERDVTVTILTSKGSGTGFVIHRDCDVYVVTAQHVVGQEAEVRVMDVPFDNSREQVVFDAEVTKTSVLYDLALLKLAPEAIPHFRESATLNLEPLVVGQRISHVGSVLGPSNAESYSEGVVSFADRLNPINKQSRMDQVTCVIYPGSSGGPVFDEYGRVVGVALLSAAPQLSLTCPTSIVKSFLD